MQQQINLLQPPLTRPQQVLSIAQLGWAVAATVLLLLFLSGAQYWHGMQLEAQRLSLQKQHQSLDKSVKALQQSLAQRKPDSRLEAQLARLDAELQHKQNVLAKVEGRVFGTQDGFADVFTALARQHVRGLWLTELHLSNGGQALDLQGSALDPKLLPQYLQRLRSEPSLSGIEFEAFLMERPKQQNRKIDFDLRSRTSTSGAKG